MDDLKLCLYDLESFRRSKKCPDHLENVAGLSKILQNHLLCAFVANLKIDALYPESFCGKNCANRNVFAFCDSALDSPLSSKKASESQKDVTPPNPLKQVLLETTWDQNIFVQTTSKDFKTSPAIFLHGCHSLTRETMMIR